CRHRAGAEARAHQARDSACLPGTTRSTPRRPPSTSCARSAECPVSARCSWQDYASPAGRDASHVSRLLKIALRLLKIALSPDSQPHFERSEEICLFTEEAGEFQQPVS